MFESAPALFSVEDTSIAALCVAGATFEAIYSWLEDDPKTRMPAEEVARTVARFNTPGRKKKPAKTRVEQPHAFWIPKRPMNSFVCTVSRPAPDSCLLKNWRVRV